MFWHTWRNCIKSRRQMNPPTCLLHTDRPLARNDFCLRNKKHTAPAAEGRFGSRDIWPLCTHIAKVPMSAFPVAGAWDKAIIINMTHGCHGVTAKNPRTSQPGNTTCCTADVLQIYSSKGLQQQGEWSDRNLKQDWFRFPINKAVTTSSSKNFLTFSWNSFMSSPLFLNF